MAVQDIDRPDVSGTPPKMAAICEQAQAALEDCAAGFLRIRTDDNTMSSVEVRGTVERREDWSNGIFQNGRYFIFFIRPEKGRRYYNPDDTKVTVELSSSSYKTGKFRKYTGPPARCIDRIRAWIATEVKGYYADRGFGEVPGLPD